MQENIREGLGPEGQPCLPPRVIYQTIMGLHCEKSIAEGLEASSHGVACCRLQSVLEHCEFVLVKDSKQAIMGLHIAECFRTFRSVLVKESKQAIAGLACCRLKSVLEHCDVFC